MFDPAIDAGLNDRRAALSPRAVPPARLDYGVRLERALGDGGDGHVTLIFVPDKRTLDPQAFDAYLRHLDTAAGDAEALALTVLEDVVNELVCRWARVILTLQGKTVTAEDRQPGWHNDALLARI